MKQITLSIPEEKYEFFVELIHNLDFVSINDFEIPEAHQKLVIERIKTSTPESLKNWDEIKNQFKNK